MVAGEPPGDYLKSFRFAERMLRGDSKCRGQAER